MFVHIELIYYWIFYWQIPADHEEKTSIFEWIVMSSRLKTIYFEGFDGSMDELKFVRHVLKEASFLETMKISSSCLNSEEKLHVLQELLMFPKKSRTCKIAFIWILFFNHTLSLSQPSPCWDLILGLLFNYKRLYQLNQLTLSTTNMSKALYLVAFASCRLKAGKINPVSLISCAFS